MKISNNWVELYRNKKNFHLRIIEILTLKQYALSFLMKLSADKRDVIFLLDSWSKTKIFQNISRGNSLYFW